MRAFTFAALRYKVEIAYDGTDFSGWQSQPNAPTVQDSFEQALAKVLNKDSRVVGCGRTDAGVHASSYVLHFDSEESLGDKFRFKMNQVLPHSIAVLSTEACEPDFHARFGATARTYYYLIHFEKDPFKQGKSYRMFKRPDLAVMNECAQILLEYDDFASFCKAGADNKTTLCSLSQAEWLDKGDHWVFIIRADRFLRNMVRAIVGTMLEVGLGKRKLEDFRDIVEAKDRTSSGKSAAACGLYLAKIEY